MRAAVLGASGYVGGELARLLLEHPHTELVQVTSDHFAGQPLSLLHPNLYGITDLCFSKHDEIQSCDVLFLALPHGVAMQTIARWRDIAPLIIDLSADFRLFDAQSYQKYYTCLHPDETLLHTFVPGIPEFYRERIKQATHISIPGCMANAAILALHPLTQAKLIDGWVMVNGHTGSSGSGTEHDLAGMHAERSGVMRVFKPSDHRHQIEISQICAVPVQMTAMAVEAVRGVQVVCQCSLGHAITEQEIWRLLRLSYEDEPFIRLVKRRSGAYRLPEPKILAGTNYCDIGFALANDKEHLVLIAALDNLVKGSAGNAIQCLNIKAGWNERDGLTFSGLHPI